jgi:hypothetical protein
MLLEGIRRAASRCASDFRIIAGKGVGEAGDMENARHKTSFKMKEISMWIFNQAPSAARTALIYITAGALMVIWTGVWYLYLRNNPPETNSVYYWCGGLLATGLTLMVIGFGLGRIGRAARHADMPAEIAPTVAVTPPSNAIPTAVVPASPIVPAVATDGRAQAPMPQAEGSLSTSRQRVNQPADRTLR